MVQNSTFVLTTCWKSEQWKARTFQHWHLTLLTGLTWTSHCSSWRRSSPAIHRVSATIKTSIVLSVLRDLSISRIVTSVLRQIVERLCRQQCLLKAHLFDAAVQSGIFVFRHYIEIFLFTIRIYAASLTSHAGVGFYEISCTYAVPIQ